MSVELLNCDCMEYMRDCADNSFDLAIVDPPYGIGANKMTLGNGKNKIFRGSDDWDAKPPSKEYFIELFRVSKNQIIWGANHFIEQFSKNSSNWIFWDKGTGSNDFADGELAWGSFDKTVRKFSKSWVGANAKDCGSRIHPTQKPKVLYDWLLKTYSEPNQRVLDTHLGSGSSAIAAHYFGCDFVGMEIDKDYYTAACERFDRETRQLSFLYPYNT